MEEVLDEVREKDRTSNALHKFLITAAAAAAAEAEEDGGGVSKGGE